MGGGLTTQVALASGRRGLVAALVVDNVGSGLFMPLSIVFVVRVVGLSVALAGTLLTVGAAAGLAAPGIVAALGTRVRPRTVVTAAMLIQAAGLGAFLLAHGPALTVLAAVLVSAGTQTFYSALFALIAEVAGDGPKDHEFAAVAMARSAAFGAGSLLAALALTALDTNGLRVAIVVDAASFLLAAAVLRTTVHPDPGAAAPRPDGAGPAGTVLRDRPFLVLIGTVTLLMLASDVNLVGMPVYALDVLRTPGWVPGAALALLTLASSTLGGVAVRRTARFARTSVLAAAAWCLLAWCALVAVTAALPRAAATPMILASTVVLIAGTVLANTRVNAIAEAAAPVHARGRYLAVFQYGFTVAALLAPLVVALFAVASWLPWVMVAATTAAGIAALPWLSRRLPARAVRPPLR